MLNNKRDVSSRGAVFVEANNYTDNTTLKEIKDGQLAASLFL